MAREGRQKSGSGIYHVLLRGVDRLFLKTADYEAFRLRLAEHISGGANLLAYLLLPNRVHLLIREGTEGLSAVVKTLCTSYARYFNRTYAADGKLFYDRFKSVPAETEEEIADTVAYLNAIGESFADGVNFSMQEYRRGAGLCDISLLSELIGSRMLSDKPHTLHLDDYGQLTPEEQEKYLQIMGYTAEKIAGMSRQSEEFELLFSGRGASARKLLPVFGIKPAAAKPVKPSVKTTAAAEDKQEQQSEQEQKPQKTKRDLSVWLL